MAVMDEHFKFYFMELLKAFFKGCNFPWWIQSVFDLLRLLLNIEKLDSTDIQ